MRHCVATGWSLARLGLNTSTPTGPDWQHYDSPCSQFCPKSDIVRCAANLYLTTRGMLLWSTHMAASARALTDVSVGFDDDVSRNDRSRGHGHSPGQESGLHPKICRLGVSWRLCHFIVIVAGISYFRWRRLNLDRHLPPSHVTHHGNSGGSMFVNTTSPSSPSFKTV